MIKNDTHKPSRANTDNYLKTRLQKSSAIHASRITFLTIRTHRYTQIKLHMPSLSNSHTFTKASSMPQMEHSTAGSLPVKEHSTAGSLPVKEHSTAGSLPVKEHPTKTPLKQANKVRQKRAPRKIPLKLRKNSKIPILNQNSVIQHQHRIISQPTLAETKESKLPQKLSKKSKRDNKTTTLSNIPQPTTAPKPPYSEKKTTINLLPCKKHTQHLNR